MKDFFSVRGRVRGGGRKFTFINRHFESTFDSAVF